MKLVAHPDTVLARVAAIDATVWKDGDQWRFRFLVEGAEDLVVPAQQSSARTDTLWRHCCFEAFVGLEGEAYLELNFSPSSQWAAYRFDRYRGAMRAEAAEVEIRVEAGEGWLALEAAVECAALDAGSSLGLSAVIEEQGGTSYWALAHPAGQPDFHDRTCFLARLPE